jgi:glycosyltransferase involved in cell wall biosynthesis
MKEVFADWLKQAVSAADRIVTISDYSRRDLDSFRRAEDLPKTTIDVVRLGEDFADANDLGTIPDVPSLRAGRPFVLSVGSIEPRKNHSLLYQVWKTLAQRLGEQTPLLVLVGGKSGYADNVLFQMQNDPLTAAHVVWLSHGQDQELVWLYRHCLFTLFPTLYEGWGLPVAESLGLGKCCIASCTSSVPEVGGDLVDYHAPNDPDGCLRLIERALDPAYRAARTAQIQRRYRLTKWADTAKQMLTWIDACAATPRQVERAA